MASEPVLYLRVKIRDLFPPDDPLIPPMLRLMPAVNDLRTLHKMFLHANNRIGHTESEGEIINAESRYLFRLTCATVYEAGRALQDLRVAFEAPESRGMIERMPEETRAAFYALTNLFPEDFDSHTDHGKILARTRHSIFHYPEPRLVHMGLQRHDDVGRLIVGRIVGASRYLLADDLQIEILARLLGGPFADQLQHLIELLIAASGYFGELLDGMVALYMQVHEGAIVEQREDTVDLEGLWNINP